MRGRERDMGTRAVRTVCSCYLTMKYRVHNLVVAVAAVVAVVVVVVGGGWWRGGEGGGRGERVVVIFVASFSFRCRVEFQGLLKEGP